MNPNLDITNKIFNSNCLEVLPQIADGSVDMILCDPPYGTTSAWFDKKINSETLMQHFLRITKDNGAIVLFSQLPFACELIAAAKKFFRYEIIYKKRNPVGFFNANKMPLRIHENILIFYKKLPPYNPQFTAGMPYKSIRHGLTISYSNATRTATINDGYRYPVDVLEYALDADKFHPHQKPVALCEWLIKTYTNAGDLVLDACMGAGSSMVAAKKNGRNFCGIEIEEKYFNIAKNRIEQTEKTL